MKTKQNQYQPQSKPEHPGVTLETALIEIGMSIGNLANIIEEDRDRLTQIISGKSDITIQIAVKLEYLLNISATFWMNRQRRYNG